MIVFSLGPTVRQGLMIYFKNVLVLIKDIYTPMVAIFISVNQILCCIHYVHLLILVFNSTGDKLSYSSVEFFLFCCSQ